MKKIFETPAVEIVKFKTEDILTLSSEELIETPLPEADKPN